MQDEAGKADPGTSFKCQDAADDVVEVNDNRITLTYVGRGSESITLCLNGNYSDEMRVKYARENLARLEKIKSDLVSWAA